MKDLEGASFSDLIGLYPYTLACGNCYLFVLYPYDANAILMEYMKNWGDIEM